ncbi:MAG: nucleoside deaminase [Clostridia bacterium]|nr:nucleoside deaminase [Clostridia bacterium]
MSLDEQIRKTKSQNEHERFMLLAIKEAMKSYALGECPIGCVIVKDGKVISRAHNLRMTKNNSLYHAEVLAINKACKKLNSWRLLDCDIYVTLEPCTMCSGSIIQSRIRNLYFGAYEPKSGAICSCNDILNVKHGHNHEVTYEGGILEELNSTILKTFFKELRESKKIKPQ